MSTEATDKTAAPEEKRFTVEVPESTSTSFEGGKATTSSQEATTFEADKPGNDEEPLEEEAAEVEAEGSTEGDEPKDETPDADLEDLGEYKPEDPDTKAKFDKRYYKEDGTLNTEALSKEFWANTAKAEDGKGGLNEATYAYLQDVIGIDKASAQKIEAGLVAQRKAEVDTFFAKVGGKERFESAIKWAVEGGYTKEQRDRYNALQEKGGADAEEAAELLVSRFRQQGKGSERAPGERRPGDRRPSSPQRKDNREAPRGERRERDAQGEAFKDLNAYSEAWKEATRKESEARRGGDKEAIRAAEQHRKDVYAKGRRFKQR